MCEASSPPIPSRVTAKPGQFAASQRCPACVSDDEVSLTLPGRVRRTDRLPIQTIPQKDDIAPSHIIARAKLHRAPG
jgi:hypothetical protein